MQGPDQQAYDRGTTTFSPDGRLYQVEYARKAITQGEPSIGIRTAEGTVLAVKKPIDSPLLEERSIEKLHRITDRICVASAGHVADGRQLIDFARRQAQVERLRYGEAIDVEPLTKAVTDHMQAYTQQGGTRPFGVGLLIAGVTDRSPRLFDIDPGGRPSEWRARVVGNAWKTGQEHLEAAYTSDLALDGGIELALETLEVMDKSPTARSVGIATVDEDAEAERQLSKEDIEAYLDRLDI